MHGLQDATQVSQSSGGRFEVPEWSSVNQKRFENSNQIAIYSSPIDSSVTGLFSTVIPKRVSASRRGKPPHPFLVWCEGIKGYAVPTRAAKRFVLWHNDVRTLSTNVCAVGLDIHCHKVVESNTIRTADDHRLAPQSEFSVPSGRKFYTQNC